MITHTESQKFFLSSHVEPESRLQWSALKISLYELIVSQLKNDDLSHIAKLLMEELQLKDHTSYCKDFLYTIYERALLDPLLLQRWKRLRNNASQKNITMFPENDVMLADQQNKKLVSAYAFSKEQFPGNEWTPLALCEIPPATNGVSQKEGDFSALHSMNDETPLIYSDELERNSFFNDIIENNKTHQVLNHARPIWFVLHRQVCNSVALSPDGRYAASGGDDCTVRLIKQHNDMSIDISLYPSTDTSMENKVRTKLFTDHTMPITALDFSSDSRFFVSGSKDCCINVFDVTKSKYRRSVYCIKDSVPISALAFHPSGDFLYSGTEHPMIRCYDLTTLECYTTRRPADHHISSITALVCSDLGGCFISASFDGSIHFWDTRVAQQINKLYTPHSGFHVASLALSRDQKMLLSGGADGKARLWDLRNGHELLSYIHPSYGSESRTLTTQAVFVGAGHHVACIYNDVTLFHAVTGTYLNSFAVHKCEIVHIASHRNENILLTGATDFKCRCIELCSENPSVTQAEELNISF